MPLRFRKQHDSRRQVSLLLSDFDYHFVHQVAATLGISKSEFMRRVIHSLRDEYAKAGLYRLPTDVRSVPAIVNELAKQHLPACKRARLRSQPLVLP